MDVRARKEGDAEEYCGFDKGHGGIGKKRKKMRERERERSRQQI